MGHGDTRFVVDQDWHIHSVLSKCCRDAGQTNDAILNYAKEYGLKSICLTNHFWDEDVKSRFQSDFYRLQGWEHLLQALPLPGTEGVEFLFGGEADMDREYVLGITPEHAAMLDWIVVSTTHMHMMGFTIAPEEDSSVKRAEVYVHRLEHFLDAELPWGKVGIAHLTAPHIGGSSKTRLPDSNIKILNLIPDDVFYGLFREIAAKNIGVELNFNALRPMDSSLDDELRIYRIASDCGCKFYFGSDSHSRQKLSTSKQNFERTVEFLQLTEDQKFKIIRKKQNKKLLTVTNWRNNI